MCLPVAAVAAVAALAIAQKVVQGYGQIQQARAERAERAVLTDQRSAQRQEIAAQASAQAGERVKAGRAERARVRVAAGEANISGISYGDMLANSMFSQSEDVAMIGRNEFFADRASESRYRAGMIAAHGPSALELGLGIASAGYSGVQSGLNVPGGQNYTDVNLNSGASLKEPQCTATTTPANFPTVADDHLPTASTRGRASAAGRNPSTSCATAARLGSRARTCGEFTGRSDAERALVSDLRPREAGRRVLQRIPRVPPMPRPNGAREVPRARRAEPSTAPSAVRSRSARARGRP